MLLKSMKSIICLFAVFLFIALAFSCAFADSARCTIVKVAARGQRLSDVIKCDAYEMYVTQLLNNLQNPYDLKEGMKILVPEKEFMQKVKGLSLSELKKEINEYRNKIPETMIKEVNESIYGVTAPASDETRVKKADKTVKGEGLKQLINQEPQELKKTFFPTRPTQ